jgi:hypothetical protein
MARHRLVEKFFIRLSVRSPKTFVSPSTTAPRNENDLSIESWIVDGEKLLWITSMRPPDLLAKTGVQRLGALKKDGMTILYAKDLPNAATQPFRFWHPPRMKTALRNRSIGRKIAIK